MRSSFEQLAASLASIAGLGVIAAALMLASWLIAKWLGRVGNAADGESIAGGGADKAASHTRVRTRHIAHDRTAL